MAENFFNLAKETSKFRNHRVPNNRKPKKPTLRDIINKMSKVKDKERILKVATQRKVTYREVVTFREASLTLSADFTGIIL